jgi:hypothetical protein
MNNLIEAKPPVRPCGRVGDVKDNTRVCMRYTYTNTHHLEDGGVSRRGREGGRIENSEVRALGVHAMHAQTHASPLI